MAGFVFISDSITHPVFLHRNTIGITEKALSTYQAVQPGDTLFIYHLEQQALFGPYLALSTITAGLEPHCFADLPPHLRFPVHVKFSKRCALGKPLPKDDIHLLAFSPAGKPQHQVTDGEALKLSRYLENHNRARWNPDLLDTRDICSHFVLRCDNATIPYIFGKNLFGITKSDYSQEFYKLREGSLLFAWHIHEQRMFGVWQALQHAEYDPLLLKDMPTRTPLQFIVHAERYVTTHLTIGPDWLAAMLHIYTYPPLTLNYQHGRLLLEYFRGTEDLRPYRPGPKAGYISAGYSKTNQLAHALIADWLHRHKIEFFYHQPVEYPGGSFYPDFYLPVYDIYIEYLGKIADPPYPEYTASKEKLFRHLHFDCLFIKPRDLEVLDWVLSRAIADRQRARM